MVTTIKTNNDYLASHPEISDDAYSRLFQAISDEMNDSFTHKKITDKNIPEKYHSSNFINYVYSEHIATHIFEMKNISSPEILKQYCVPIFKHDAKPGDLIFLNSDKDIFPMNIPVCDIGIFIDKESMAIFNNGSVEIQSIPDNNKIYSFARFSRNINYYLDPISNLDFKILFENIGKVLGNKNVFEWGHSNENTFDCSGFIHQLFNNSGIVKLERRNCTGYCYYNSLPIFKHDLKPGDLVFFENTIESNNPITHIGMYVGGGMFAHAKRPSVYLNSIDDPHWKKHIYGFGRIIRDN